MSSRINHSLPLPLSISKFLLILSSYAFSDHYNWRNRNLKLNLDAAGRDSLNGSNMAKAADWEEYQCNIFNFNSINPRSSEYILESDYFKIRVYCTVGTVRGGRFEHLWLLPFLTSRSPIWLQFPRYSSQLSLSLDIILVFHNEICINIPPLLAFKWT